MKPMAELIKYLKFLVISNIFIILVSCDTIKNNKEVDDNTNKVLRDTSRKIYLTRDDSVIKLANDLNIDFNPEKENINDVLDKILKSKISLITRLDSLNEKVDELELAAIRYKKKENIELKQHLYSEIERIKNELERIKKLAKIDDSDLIVKVSKNAIPELKLPEIVSTLENLPSGNYTTRLDKYYIISIFVTENGEIITGQPKLDSTTIIKGRKLDDRIAKELEQIKENFNKK